MTEIEIKAAAEKFMERRPLTLAGLSAAEVNFLRVAYLDVFQAGANFARGEMETETKRYKALYEDYSQEVDELQNERNALREQLKVANYRIKELEDKK